MTDDQLDEWAEANKFAIVKTVYAPSQLTVPVAGVVVGYWKGHVLLALPCGNPADCYDFYKIFDGYEKYGSTFWSVAYDCLLLPDIPKKSLDFPHLCPRCQAPACILFTTVDCSKGCGV